MLLVPKPPHPRDTDRRRILITHTAEPVNRSEQWSPRRARMMAPAVALMDVEAETVVSFLERMQDAASGGLRESPSQRRYEDPPVL